MARWRAPGAAGSTRVRQPSPDLGRQGRKAWGELPTGGLRAGARPSHRARPVPRCPGHRGADRVHSAGRGRVAVRSGSRPAEPHRGRVRRPVLQPSGCSATGGVRGADGDRHRLGHDPAHEEATDPRGVGPPWCHFIPSSMSEARAFPVGITHRWTKPPREGPDYWGPDSWVLRMTNEWTVGAHSPTAKAMRLPTKAAGQASLTTSNIESTTKTSRKQKTNSAPDPSLIIPPPVSSSALPRPASADTNSSTSIRHSALTYGVRCVHDQGACTGARAAMISTDITPSSPSADVTLHRCSIRAVGSSPIFPARSSRLRARLTSWAA